MEKDLDQEHIQPSVTTVPTESATTIHSTTLPEAGEAIGRAVGGFFAALFPGKKTLTSDTEKLMEENDELIEEARKLAMYCFSLKSKY